MPNIEFIGNPSLINDDETNSAPRDKPAPIRNEKGINTRWSEVFNQNFVKCGAIIPIKTIGPQYTPTIPDNSPTSGIIKSWYLLTSTPKLSA